MTNDDAFREMGALLLDSAKTIGELQNENARLREALNDVIDYAEDWYWSYCEMWGQRRKEQQEQILANINKARVELGDEV